MKNIKDYEVVVGIDFGSSGTGFAYSFFNPNDVVVGQIPGASVNNKVPTRAYSSGHCCRFARHSLGQSGCKGT